MAGDTSLRAGPGPRRAAVRRDPAQGSFGAVEAAVRRRLAPWTDPGAGRSFAALDTPLLLDPALSERLLCGGTDTVRRCRAVEGLADAALRRRADGRLVATGGRFSEIYREVLERAAPRADAAEARPASALYVAGGQGEEPSPLYARYRHYRDEVARIERCRAALRANPLADPATLAEVEAALARARADLSVLGHAEVIEALVSAPESSDPRTRDWTTARARLSGGTATRCRPVPRADRIEVPLGRTATGASSPRLSASLRPVLFDREEWYDHAVLTDLPWDWTAPEDGRIVSDGKGGGDCPLLPVGAVLLGDIRLTLPPGDRGRAIATPGRSIRRTPASDGHVASRVRGAGERLMLFGYLVEALPALPPA